MKILILFLTVILQSTIKTSIEDILFKRNMYKKNSFIDHLIQASYHRADIQAVLNRYNTEMLEYKRPNT
jgi:lysyl-tRNA synthetase class I